MNRCRAASLFFSGITAAIIIANTASAATLSTKLKEALPFSSAVTSISVETPRGSISVNPHQSAELTANISLEAKAMTKTRARVLLDESKLVISRTESAISLTIKPPVREALEVVKADIQIYVPAIWSGNCDVIATEGSISISGFAGQAALSTTNGSIRVHDWLGSVDALTTNGSISIDVHPTDLRGVVAVTTNGSISLIMPKSASVTLAAYVTNGKIAVSGFDNDCQVQTKLLTKLNGGGARVRLSTINGNVAVGAKSH